MTSTNPSPLTSPAATNTPPRNSGSNATSDARIVPRAPSMIRISGMAPRPAPAM
jgi:hypothetical protein